MQPSSGSEKSPMVYLSLMRHLSTKPSTSGWMIHSWPRLKFVRPVLSQSGVSENQFVSSFLLRSTLSTPKKRSNTLTNTWILTWTSSTGRKAPNSVWSSAWKWATMFQPFTASRYFECLLSSSRTKTVSSGSFMLIIYKGVKSWTRKPWTVRMPKRRRKEWQITRRRWGKIWFRSCRLMRISRKAPKVLRPKRC